MADKIYTLTTSPGIKRDGTDFASINFVDGEWCRFQRGKPKKVGGARLISAEPVDIPRGLLTHSINGTTYLFSGSKTGVNAFLTPTDTGIASGPFKVNLSNYTKSLNVAEYDFVSTTNVNIQVPGDQTNTGTGYITGTDIELFLSKDIVDREEDPPEILFRAGDYPYAVSNISYNSATDRTSFTLTGASTSPPFQKDPNTGTGDLTGIYPYIILVNPANPINDDNLNDKYAWTFNTVYDPAGYAFRTISHFSDSLQNVDTNNDQPVYTGRLIPQIENNTYEWNWDVLRDTAGLNPTGAVIEADGGVAAIYPFIFAYGSNGFIANNHVTTFDADSTVNPAENYGSISLNDWNGPTANQVNVAAGKILTARTIRGGSASPSGLFWATDSLIRVSFTGNAPLYWRYDIVSNDCSIMSKDSVVEQDGIFYWVGQDRFYQYNGTVSQLPNDMNLNHFFDNVNIKQRGKVFGVAVKRYNEIWWFFPHGEVDECNNAVVYNTKDKIWYDMGQSELCRRSAGLPASTFPFPIMASNDYEYELGTAYQVTELGKKPIVETTITFALDANNHPAVYEIDDSNEFVRDEDGNPVPAMPLNDMPISGRFVNVVIPDVEDTVRFDLDSTNIPQDDLEIGDLIYFSDSTDTSWLGEGTFSADVDPATGERLFSHIINFRVYGTQPDVNFDFNNINLYTGRKITGVDIEVTGETDENAIFVSGNISNNLPGTFITFNEKNPLGQVLRIATAVYIPATQVPGMPYDPGTTAITIDPPFEDEDLPQVGEHFSQYLGGYGLYQHEFGRNKTFYSTITSIPSSFTTDDVSFLGGNPAQNSPVGDNRQMKVFRVEPDFLQVGDMTLQYLGRSYSRGEEMLSEEFTFSPTDGKIDTRVQFRQIKMKFSSNDLEGDYEMGDNLVIVEPGDERA